MIGVDGPAERPVAALQTRFVMARLAIAATVALFCAMILILQGLRPLPAAAGFPGKAAAPPASYLSQGDEGTPTPTTVPDCTCSGDAYEPDNLPTEAKLLAMDGVPQSHNFDPNSDIDWFQVTGLTPGRSYNVLTSDLELSADTYMVLYDQSVVQLQANDDLDTSKCLLDSAYCASSITWVAAGAGPYYVSIRTLSHLGCPCAAYKVRGRWFGSLLPVVLLEPTFTPRPPTDTPTPTPSNTPVPTDTPTPTVQPSITPSPTPYTGSGFLYPQAVAVNHAANRLYVSARDIDQVVALDDATLQVVDRAAVGDQPWGIGYHPGTNRVFAANFASGSVSVLDGSTLDPVGTITAGPGLTNLVVGGDRVFVVSYYDNALVVINAQTLAVEYKQGIGAGAGAWGLAFNPNLNRVYVSTRNRGAISPFDGYDSFQHMWWQTTKTGPTVACSPYGVAFNPANDRLYVACAPAGNVNRLLVYGAGAGGLSALAEILIGNGGPDGGGGVAVNPATGTVFVSNSQDNTVTIVDGATNSVLTTVPVGRNPFGIGVDAVAGRAYVANRLSNDVSIIVDPRHGPQGSATPTGTPTVTPSPRPSPLPPPLVAIPRLSVPNGLAANHVTHELYVSDRQNARVYRVDLLTGAVNLTLPVGNAPFGVAVNSGANKAYVANYGSNTISVVDGKAGAVTKTVNLAPYGEPSYVALDESLNRVYVSLHRDGRLAILDGRSDTLVGSAADCSGAFGVAVDPVLHRVYVSCRDNHLIRVVDGATYAIRWGDTIFPDAEPYALAIDADLRRLYAVVGPVGGEPDRALVYRLHASGTSPIATVMLGAGGPGGGGGIAANPTTGRVAVTNTAADSVTLFDGANGGWLATLATGDDPLPVAVDRVLNRFYVGNRASGTIDTIVDVQ